MTAPSEAERPGAPTPKFVKGSLLRHILVMSGAGGVGLGAIFASDFANIVFLSWLKDQAVIAAVGYASSILFITISIGIGLGIAATTMVARTIGEGRRLRAARYAVNALILSFAAGVASAIVVIVATPWLLQVMGAEGRAHELATRYLTIVTLGLPALTVAMTSASVLRSVGDARRAMNVTLYGAVVNTILDPILIFGLGLGIDGAAWATVGSRLCFMAVGLYGVVRVHRLIARPRLPALVADISVFMPIAIPAIMTNIASPVANAYVTAGISAFGDDAVAGWAIIGRIMPVAFGPIYALSASIGPIIGQNFGAGDGARVRQSLSLALGVNVAFTAAAWLLLVVFSHPLNRLFGATGDAAALISLFNIWLSPLFAFMGALFVVNAIFNTLGFAHYATVLNWSRATVGTIPFVHLGGHLAGAEGVLFAFMGSGILFGCLAIWICRRLFLRLLPAPGTA
jgi:putative MATE family efflux protein